MDRDLEVIDRSAAHEVAKLRIGQAWQAGAGRVGVRRLEPRPARTQRAVHVKFDPAHPQPVTVKPRGWARAADQRHRLGASGIDHHAQVQAIKVARAAQRLPVLDICAHVGSGGDTAFEQQILRSGERQVTVFRARRGHDPADQARCVVDQHAGGCAAGAAHDLAACRVLGGGGDPGGFQRRAVAPAGMAIDAFKPDRAIGHRRVEFGGGGKPAEPPDFLVPPAADDPRAIGVCGSVIADFALRLGQRLRFGQIERERGEAKLEQVQVRVDQPGQQHAALAVHPVLRARQLVALVVDRQDRAIVAEPQRGEALDPAVGRDGLALDVVDQRIGLGRRRERKQRRSDRGAEGVPHAFPPLRGKRRISALVSSRPAPSAWTSA